MKKAALAILWLILSLMLPACASMTYEEIEAQAKITGDDTKLKKFEAQAQKATRWFEHKAECYADNMIWYCKRHHPETHRRNKPMSTEQLIRAYRRESNAGCMCATPGAMREMMRQMNRQRRY